MTLTKRTSTHYCVICDDNIDLFCNGVIYNSIMMCYNEHVVLYKKILLMLAEQQRKYMAQLIYYTEYMLEVDPQWKPDHLK